MPVPRARTWLTVANGLVVLLGIFALYDAMIIRSGGAGSRLHSLESRGIIDIDAEKAVAFDSRCSSGHRATVLGRRIASSHIKMELILGAVTVVVGLSNAIWLSRDWPVSGPEQLRT